MIEPRQRSPLGAPYRTPLAAFGPGVIPPVGEEHLIWFQAVASNPPDAPLCGGGTYAALYDVTSVGPFSTWDPPGPAPGTPITAVLAILMPGDYLYDLSAVPPQGGHACYVVVGDTAWSWYYAAPDTLAISARTNNTDWGPDFNLYRGAVAMEY